MNKLTSEVTTNKLTQGSKIWRVRMTGGIWRKKNRKKTQK